MITNRYKIKSKTFCCENIFEQIKLLQSKKSNFKRKYIYIKFFFKDNIAKKINLTSLKIFKIEIIVILLLQVAKSTVHVNKLIAYIDRNLNIISKQFKKYF